MRTSTPGSQIHLAAVLLVLGAGGGGASSCTSGEPVREDSPVEPVPCEQDWLDSDVNQAATYTLRGGPDDSLLGYVMAVGDLDGDGRDDLALTGQAPQVYVVLASSLFAREPGEYLITEVADYTLLVEVGTIGQKVETAIVHQALYVSRILPGSASPTYRVPFQALKEAGPTPRPVEDVADTTLHGVSTYGHYVRACDLDSDGWGDLILGEYAVLREPLVSGDVDLDADGLRIQFEEACSYFGPCTDIDGDGMDDVTAVCRDRESNEINYVFDIWYGSHWAAPSGNTLTLGEPDVAIRVSGARDENGNNGNSFIVVSPDAVGDWNGDGNLDVALAVHRTTGAWSSDVVLFLGEEHFRPAGTTLTRADAALTVMRDGDVLLGRPLALAGDLNGDGRDDLVVADHALGPDEIYVRYCPLPAGVYSTTEFSQVTFAAVDGDDLRMIGAQVASHGDLDGNGVNDLVFTAPFASANQGAVLVMAR